MWMHCGENMNAIIFGGGQRSSWVNVGQTLKSLLTRISRLEAWIDFILTVLCGCVMLKRWTLLFLVEVKGRLGSPEVKKQNFPRIPKSFIGSAEVKEQNFPRFPKIVIWGHQRSNCKFPKNSQN
ncbi:hypothetical protein HOLleu_42966 [Holothuria leucospilota]|uniref:Uncharacterized protein n=1 Tax=Holothuria leucospilota TaxID=206669 RepID=A0A9Q1BBC4_HOLLE|nr:hypothetical protein HOLleu_42966 [Holothuria leucospilota]